MGLSATDITIFLLSLSVILFFARGFGELLRYFKQPIVIGEIIAGIILGPTILGTIFPGTFNSLFNQSEEVVTALNGITLLGVVMLLLVSGIEIDLSLVLRQSRAAIVISLLGILFPFSVGFFSAYFYPEFLGLEDSSMHLVFALFVGTALSITALPVVARTLMDLQIFKSEIGYLIMAAAMFNDLVGWIIFSVVLSMIGQNSGHSLSLSSLIIVIGSFLVFVLIFVRKFIDYSLPFIQKRFTFPGGVLNFIFILGFISAAFTEYIGVHAIFGVFIMGIAIGDSVHLKKETREIIYQFVTNIFAPLFFVSIGLRINFIENFDPLIVTVFLVLAFVGKVVGCGLGAYWGGLNKNDSLIIGFGMNSRGAMEIVLGTLAYQYGLINEKVFVALIIMALVTSISSAPIMNYFLKKAKTQLSFHTLLKKEYVIFSSSQTKDEVIAELCKIVAVQKKLDFNLLYNSVMKREEIITTGLEKHLAIPHARINIKESIIAVAIVRNGIEWNSLDKLPAKFVVLLLTPEDKPEIQLNLLSDIAKKYNDIKIIEEIIASKEANELIYKVKQLY
jgi:Kef-type K+ transport system membrane component KefB/mannitol/fructose-specific phosphotransferase system IIA component (Ntr-type)